MEAVRIFLAYAVNKKFKVYQMDVKSTFMNGELEEEVYIEQFEGFPLSEDKDMVCKLKKSLNSLKQALRIQYERLDSYFANLGFVKGTIDTNFYLKEVENGLVNIVIFIDDIIFGGNDEASDRLLKRCRMSLK